MIEYIDSISKKYSLLGRVKMGDNSYSVDRSPVTGHRFALHLATFIQCTAMCRLVLRGSDTLPLCFFFFRFQMNAKVSCHLPSLSLLGVFVFVEALAWLGGEPSDWLGRNLLDRADVLISDSALTSSLSMTRRTICWEWRQSKTHMREKKSMQKAVKNIRKSNILLDFFALTPFLYNQMSVCKLSGNR